MSYPSSAARVGSRFPSSSAGLDIEDRPTPLIADEHHGHAAGGHSDLMRAHPCAQVICRAYADGARVGASCPRDMAKAELPEAQSPEGAKSRPPENRLQPALPLRHYGDREPVVAAGVNDSRGNGPPGRPRKTGRRDEGHR